MSFERTKQGLPEEGRSQPRLHAQVPIRIKPAGAAEPVRALLGDLSWGGALIHCDAKPGELGEALEIELPYHQSRSIRIDAQILRAAAEEGGGCAVAVRFTRISPAAEEHLEKVLQLLLNKSENGQRRHPRLAQRLELYFDDPADIRATLEDVSRGGLSVTVPYSFSPGQSVQLTIQGGAAIGELRLRARVVHQSRLDNEKYELYRAGLELEHPAGELQELVGRLLEKLVSRESLAKRQWQSKQ